MKAIIYERYGGTEVFQYTKLPKPEPKDNEIRIKVMATSITQGDRRLRAADPLLARLHNGLLKPKKYPVLGFEVAGIVDKVGASVSTFHKNDRVFAFNGFGFGGYADYLCLPVNQKLDKGAVALLPDNMSFIQGAVVPVGALTANGFLRQMEVTKGKDLLIIGASGSVGTYALQIAKYLDANITAVCSGKNSDLVKSLGAGNVIDYTKNPTLANIGTYDYVFDTVGKWPKKKCKHLLKPTGIYKNIQMNPGSKREDIELLHHYLKKSIITPVIDHVYNWDEIKKAHIHIDTGHKVGNIGLMVNQGEDILHEN